MSRFKIEDFPSHVQDQIRAQLADYRQPPTAPAKTPDPIPAPRQPKIASPNATEAEFRAKFSNLVMIFEPLTFRLQNGHRYTPDWVYWHDSRLHCVEVKGSYRLQSYQRARLAFDQAVIEFPEIRWIWAEKRQNGGWAIMSHCKNSEKEADHA